MFPGVAWRASSWRPPGGGEKYAKIARMTESVKDALEYVAALALLKTFGWMPRSAAYPAAEIVAAMGFRLAKRQRLAGIQNLRMAMPALRDEERRAILRGSFSNLGRLLVEFSHFPGLNKNNIANLVTYEGLRALQECRRPRKGCDFSDRRTSERGNSVASRTPFTAIR